MTPKPGSTAICKECNYLIKKLKRLDGVYCWYHVHNGQMQCDIYATPKPGTIKPPEER
jgi:hypothetical protein